ncbi:hypothetical protein H072_7772 [Dactylellina haptotyla CBS 200.50]|uniref:Apple domain-containing protein n=1 Tax=Dactylellina haptotyla (strain CBS 200.50) TaxID=1284197 RepID=S8A6M5_DACHA|nr:hypothetical protein H072_7772 [Dactylellina haptotyla CBS 200.50]
MKYSTFLTSTLLVLSPLVPTVSAWCDAINTNTYSTCNTKYGDHPVTSTKYSTRTINTGVTTTVTYTNPPETSCVTITEPDVTNTDTVTSTCTERKWCQVYTITAINTVTTTLTITNVKTKSECTTTKVYGPTITIPAPPGFTGVNDDPDCRDPRKRNNYPPGESTYPTVIACTTTFLRTCTISTTVGPYTVTSTKTIPGNTYTVTDTDTVTETVCANPTLTTATVDTTATCTTYTESCTTVTSTKTITIPGPTKYAACNPAKNILSGASPKDFSGTKCNADSAYDCCVECIKNPKCVGSYFVEGNYKADQCYLKLSNMCYGQSNTLKFEKKYGGGSISNGQCGKWKLKK